MGEESQSLSNAAIQLIFAEAVTKLPEEREGFLDLACKGDQILRNQLDQMLAEEGDEVDRKEIGGYEVIRQIGQGGMGVVYLARDPQLDREVALKLMQFGSMPHPDAIARFQQEMRAVARLSHPNIVTAYHASEHEGSQILVMEYVAGSDLASLVREKGPVSTGEAINWTLQAARGLQNAHEAGIVHRDIKPANLLLDESGTIKILDLGLARIETADPSGGGLTQSGMVMGSPDFISPEQATETRDADQRSDIYSLGCTLFYLLNGRPAFGGDSVYLKIQAHVEEPAPCLVESKSQNAEKLNAVFTRMMAKSPEDRYQTMAEVIVDLEACIREKGEAGAGRRSGAKLAATLGVATVVVVAAFWFFLNRSTVTVDDRNFPLKAAPLGGSGHFVDSGQRLGRSYSTGAKLGDFDGDGDLDAVVSNYKGGLNRVWLNDGKGNFSAAMSFSQIAATDLDVGDLDGDGDLDAIFAGRDSADQVWLNEGDARFIEWGEGLSIEMARNVTLGDINGDGILDVLVSQGGTGKRTPNSIWFGDGEVNFQQSEQEIEEVATWEVGLGDLDGDGDIDAVFANGDSHGDNPLTPNTVWLNDGHGKFEDTGQQLGKAFTRDVVLGDLDGDGDLDAVFANDNDSDPSSSWFNDGEGNFTAGNLSLGLGRSEGLFSLISTAMVIST